MLQCESGLSSCLWLDNSSLCRYADFVYPFIRRWASGPCTGFFCCEERCTFSALTGTSRQDCDSGVTPVGLLVRACLVFEVGLGISSLASTCSHMDFTCSHMDCTCSYMDHTCSHIDFTCSHMDSTCSHMDFTCYHMDCTCSHMDCIPTATCLTFIFINLFLLSSYVHGCFAHVCNTGMPCAFGGQERALEPLELGLQMALSHQVGADNGAQVSGRADSALEC